MSHLRVLFFRSVVAQIRSIVVPALGKVIVPGGRRSESCRFKARSIRILERMTTLIARELRKESGESDMYMLCNPDKSLSPEVYICYRRRKIQHSKLSRNHLRRCFVDWPDSDNTPTTQASPISGALSAAGGAGTLVADGKSRIVRLSNRTAANTNFLDRVILRTRCRCRVLKICLFQLDFDVIGSRGGTDIDLGCSLILLYESQGPYHRLSFWNSTFYEREIFDLRVFRQARESYEVGYDWKRRRVSVCGKRLLSMMGGPPTYLHSDISRFV